ncbi:MAG TPA: energy-coupling factor ABC transporter ATP-binding protein [Pseudogracilibacillus sp.]|nr:energy-coupling factor ABC transporter ATP-binding protein [Pseudogracilibacillus sp.]
MDITFKNVSYTYQPKSPFEHQALKDVSFNIPSGSFVAIIGHTGSGKSTLIQHLNGIIRPTEGEIQIGDYTISADKKLKEMKALRSKVGVVFQYPEHQLFEETIEKDIAFGPENFGVPEGIIEQRIKEVMKKVVLNEAMLNKSPFELSGGQMRRVAIAGVLASEPRIYVLDEPTAGLDPRGQKEIMDMFYDIHHEKKEQTTILVTHSMEDALQYADYIIILNQGEKYMEGMPEDIFSKEDALKAVHLELPESIQFLQAYNKRFNTQFPLKKQSIREITNRIMQNMQ